MKAITWQKDSHSLFDYEFNKNVVQNTFDFPLEAKFIYIFRNNTSTILMIKHARLPLTKKISWHLIRNLSDSCWGVYRSKKTIKDINFNFTTLRSSDKKLNLAPQGPILRMTTSMSKKKTFI